MTRQPRRRARVKPILLVAAAVSVPIALTIILKSDWMAGRVAARLVHEIEKISDRKADLDGVTLRFFPPGIDLRGLRLEGPPQRAGGPHAGGPPLLSLRSGGVRLKVLPLFAGEWIPSAVELDGLDVHLSGDGRPVLGEGAASGAAGPIAIPRLSVRDGHVTYGASTSQIHFEADDLELTMRPFTCPGGGCAGGDLSGKRFAVAIGPHRLAGSALGIDLEARGDLLTIRRVNIEGPDLTIGGKGSVAIGGAPIVSASAQLSAQGEALSDLIGELPLRAERLDARAEIRMEAGALTATGTSTLISPRYGDLAAAASVDARFSVRDGGATIDLDAVGLLLPFERLTPIGTGSGTARVLVTPDGEVRATLSIDSIRYRDLLGILHPGMPHADIDVQGAGEIRLDGAAASITGGFLDLEVRPAGTRGGALDRERVELSGRARLEITPDAFEIQNAAFNLGGVRAGAQGRIASDASRADLDLSFKKADLSRLLALMPRRPPADAVVRTFEGGAVSGTIHLSIGDGSMRASGRLRGEDLILSAGIDPPGPFDAALDWSVDPARLTLSRIDLSGSGWSTEGAIEIDLRDGPRLRVARLSMDGMPAAPIWSLAGIDLVAGGVVSGRVVLDPGPASDGPAGSTLDLVLERPRVSGIDLDRVVLRGGGSGERLRIDSLLVEGGEVRAEAHGDYDLAGARLRLDLIETEIDLAAFEGLFDRIPGDAGGRISPMGSLVIDPQGVTFQGAARGEDLHLADLPIGELNVSSVVYDTAADPALVMSFTASALAIRGDVTWSAATGIGVDLTFEETPLDPIGTLLAGAVGADVGGLLSGTLHAATPLNDFAAGRLELDIKRSELTYGAIRVVSSTPSRVAYRDRRWQLDRMHLTGDGTDLDLSGTWDTRPDLPATGSVSGRLDASLLSLFFPDLVARGVIEIEIALQALDGGVEYGGHLEVRDAALGHSEIPISLDRLSLSARVTPDGSILIDGLEGSLGGGSVTGSGRCDLDGMAIRSCSLELTGKDMQTEPAPNLLLFFDARLTLDVDPQGSALAGQVDVLRALYTLRPDVSFKALLGADPSVKSLVDGEAPFPLALDLLVDAPGEVWVRGENVMLEGAARMTVAGTSAAPEVAGRISVFEGGRIVFRDVPYTSEEGSIDFDAPDGIDPSLNMSAVTRVGDYEIRLRVLGRASDPRVELTSDPPLASRDIVFLLLTGETYEESFNQGTGTAFLAEGQVGQYLTVPLSRALDKTIAEPLGLTTVQIAPQFQSSTADPTARLTVTKRVSPDLTLRFSSDLGDSQAQIYLFDYRIGRRWSFVGLRDLDQTVSGNITFRHRWGRSDRRRDEERITGGGSRVTGTTGRVSVEGNPLGDDRDLLGRIPLREGRPFTRARALEGREGLRKRLAAAGYPLAVVRLRYEGMEGGADPPAGAKREGDVGETGGDAVRVLYRIEAGSRVRLQIDSPDHRKALLNAVRAEWNTVLRDADLEPAGERAIRQRLEELGHATPRIESTTRDEGDGVVLRYEVSPGPKIKIRSLRFPGASAIDERTLQSSITSREDRWNRSGILRPSILSRDAATLEGLYRERGHLDIRIDEPRIETDEEGHLADVWIGIDEGPIYRIGEVRVEGGGSIGSGPILEAALLSPGTPLGPSRIGEAEKRVRELLDERGFREARVRTRVDRSSTEVGLTIVVEEGERRVVDRIGIEGNRSTDDGVIGREITLKPDAPLSDRALAETRNNLYGLGLFDYVDLHLDPRPDDPGRTDLTVRVEEGRPWLTGVGAGYDSEEEFVGSFLLGHRNLFGTGRSASLYLRGSSINRRARFSILDRRLFGFKTEGVFTTFIEEEENESFDERRTGVGFVMTRRINPRLTFLAQYSIEDSDVLRIGPFLPSDFDLVARNLRFANVGASIARDTRNDLLDPSGGALWSVDLKLYDDAIGSEAEFTRLSLGASGFRTLTPRLVLAGSARIGVSWPHGLSIAIPLAERFFAGGDTTLRGFDIDRAGPLAPATLDPVGGELSILLNGELRYPIWGNIGGTFFYDAGNVFLRTEDLRLTGTTVIEEAGCSLAIQDGFRHILGAGFVWRTPIGPIRVEYGHKLDRRMDRIDFTRCLPDGTKVQGSRVRDEPSGRLFLSVGHAF